MCAIMGFSTKKLDKHEIWEYFDRTLSRGPDMSKIMDTGSGWLCFHRLANMGQRLLEVIRHNQGGANKDLAKFASQIAALCDKWDR